jgi:hypothetical protein
MAKKISLSTATPLLDFFFGGTVLAPVTNIEEGIGDRRKSGTCWGWPLQGMNGGVTNLHKEKLCHWSFFPST